MTDTPLFDTATEEQASLYVLDLLSPEDRQHFESRLAQDAALREFVRELQGNLDAEVFAEPAPAAPLTVWGKISARTRPDHAAVLAFPRPVVVWSRRILAAAACVALGIGLHMWWSVPPASAVANETELGTNPATKIPTAITRAATPGPTLTNRATVPGTAGEVATTPNLTPPDAPARELEKIHLEQRVRILTAQVARMNEVLTQQLAAPSGVTRLHFFQFGPGGSNTLNTTADPERGRKLVETLARLAADQMAAANPPPPGTSGTGSETTSPNPEKPAEPSTTQVAVLSVVPATPTATADEAATLATTASVPTNAVIGFLNADSGEGAFVADSYSDGLHQAQLWQATGDGKIFSLGVVPTSASPLSVINFQTLSLNGTGTLFMTIEPQGGSFQPTGPVAGSIGSNNLPHP